MSMNQTPSSERVHIGFFGRRNAGKSSVMNAVTGQDIAVVSDVRGTTTDPVYKSMELLPLGPVVMMDTPGIDDEGELGTLRVRKSYQVLNKTDAAVLVIDGTVGAMPEDMALLERIREKKIPYVIAVNKKEVAEEAALKKVMGSSRLQLFIETASGFIKSVGISIIVALPITWVAVSKWLEGYSYRIDNPVYVYIIAIMVMLLIALLSISWQMINLMNTNPVKSLKAE